MKIIGFEANNNWQTLFRLELLRSVRHWLDALEVQNQGCSIIVQAHPSSVSIWAWH